MNALRRAALLVLWPALAQAASFPITISNSTTSAWSAGLLSLKILLPLGLTPQPGSPYYPGYAFSTAGCNVSDAFCSGACDDTGNPTVLAQRAGLTLGTNAWLVPALAAGGSATITITTTDTTARLSYMAFVVGSTDDWLALHPTGVSGTLSVPLFSGTTPLENVSFELGGYDSNTVSMTDGNAASCTPACPVPATGCYVSQGNGTVGSTLPAQPTPNVLSLTVVAGNGANTLRWTNVGPHDGVVIVRRTGSAATLFTPVAGTTYTVGQTVNATAPATTVVYADNGATASSTFVDTGLTNGTRYFYKVFAFANGRRYANGAVPSSAGIFSEPTAKTGQAPLWCYSVGLPTMQQPVTELGAAVFTASNTGGVTASKTTVGTPATDGTERWRPVQLTAAIQNRATVVPLQGRSGRYLITGDQGGKVFAIDSSNGSVIWQATVGTNIQAQVAVQLYAFANAAFTAAQPGRDLVFVATRNASATNNQVTALSSVNGSVVWTYQPGNLDIVSGGMAVDYTNNRLWVAARDNAGSASVRVLSTLNGAQQAALTGLGPVDYGFNLDFTSQQAYTVNNTGTARGFSLAAMTQVWSFAMGGAPTSYIFPLGNGFIASLGTGAVRRYTVAGTTVTQNWTTAVAGPSGVTVDYTNQKVLVGSSDGNLRQLNLSTGVVEKTVPFTPGTSTTVGWPTIDATAGRVHVGSLDGRLCAWPLPLP